MEDLAKGNTNYGGFNDKITIVKVKSVISSAQAVTASGIDNMSVEVLKNKTSVQVLYVLFNACFDSGTILTAFR